MVAIPPWFLLILLALPNMHPSGQNAGTLWWLAALIVNAQLPLSLWGQGAVEHNRAERCVCRVEKEGAASVSFLFSSVITAEPIDMWHRFLLIRYNGFLIDSYISNCFLTHMWQPAVSGSSILRNVPLTRFFSLGCLFLPRNSITSDNLWRLFLLCWRHKWPVSLR